MIKNFKTIKMLCGFIAIPQNINLHFVNCERKTLSIIFV